MTERLWPATTRSAQPLRGDCQVNPNGAVHTELISYASAMDEADHRNPRDDAAVARFRAALHALYSSQIGHVAAREAYLAAFHAA